VVSTGGDLVGSSCENFLLLIADAFSSADAFAITGVAVLVLTSKAASGEAVSALRITIDLALSNTTSLGDDEMLAAGDRVSSGLDFCRKDQTETIPTNATSSTVAHRMANRFIRICRSEVKPAERFDVSLTGFKDVDLISVEAASFEKTRLLFVEEFS